MHTKVLTMNCPSCPVMFIDEDNQFRCKWGNSKKGKVLIPHKGKRPKECKLKVDGG